MKTHYPKCSIKYRERRKFKTSRIKFDYLRKAHLS